MLSQIFMYTERHHAQFKQTPSQNAALTIVFNLIVESDANMERVKGFT